MPQIVPSHAALALGVLFAATAHACPDPDCGDSPKSEDLLPITLVQAAPLPDSLAGLIDASDYAALDPVYQALMLRWSKDGVADAPFAMCFAPGTDPSVVAAIQTTLNRLTPRANPVDRWTSTVTNPSTSLGEPITLRYSFVPDGTQITNGGTSDLQARLNTIYANNTAAWQSLFQQAFDRWSQLSGVNYVFEPNDDGAVFPNTNGSLNVRGDVRIGGHPIDGNSNVLAYNFFPNQGDMVLDTADSYFTNTSNNSRALRNVVMHEHGHGLGFAHVCPVSGTKLMEPFANNSFDGPRHDDLRAVQRDYGDPFEPNNSAAQATVLGSLPAGTTVLGTPPAPSIPFGSTLSIDANAEQDWFRFTATANTQVGATVTPVGTSYDDSDQDNATGACFSGNIINSAQIANLEVQIFATNGTNILANANTQPLGAAETATAILPAAGDYFIRVAESDAPLEAQLYSLSIQITAPNIAISQIGETPRVVPPNAPVSADFDIVGNLQAIQPGSPTLNFRLQGESTFQTAPMNLVAGNQYRASLPLIACGQTIEYFVSARGTAGAIATYPADAPATLLATSAGVAITVLEDDFESDRGWTVNSTAATGQWVRADPVGTTAQPEDDHSASGTICFVTGNGTPGGPVGAADIDGGNTILLSPPLDLSGALDTTISYWRWFHNATNSGQANSDTFPIEISGTNGITWNPVETVGPTTENVGGWIQHTFNTSDIPGFVPSSLVRLRFIAQDTGNASVVEAAIDDVVVTKISCPTVPTCVADKDDGSGTGTPDGAVTIDDLLYFVAVFNLGDIAADVDDGSSTATPDGAVTIDDLLYFIVRFNAGC
ncbi:MAG: matrixin family metalloprotease [Phycisphaerales bacterium]|nr:MAG: matrixin family metalloprotease [Phycisphaerales bacterium]